MNLSKELSLIKQREYQPVYSAKLTSHLTSLKKRPKTCIFDSNKEQNRIDNRSSISKSALSGKSSSLNLIPIRKSESIQQTSALSKKSQQLDLIKNMQDKDNENDDNMTNISMLTVKSYETIRPKKIYGRFQTFSHFERYMNRRAKIKLQTHLIPKLPPEYEQDIPEPSLFDLLAEDELSTLYDLFKIQVAVPFRLRSFSVCCDRNSVSNLNNYSNKNTKKYQSTERIYDSKYTIREKDCKSYMQISSIVNLNDDQNSNLSTDTFTISKLNIGFIKGPIIYEIGRKCDLSLANQPNKKDKKINQLDKHIDVININNILSSRKKHFNHIKSSLESNYFDQMNKSKFKKNSLIYYSRSALDRHVEINTLQSRQNKIETKSHIQISDLLENKIRENLKMNKGPVYFAQLTHENIKLHNENKEKVDLKEKFYNIYEWMGKINVNECSHYFMNPFKRDKNNMTDNCDMNSKLVFGKGDSKETQFNIAKFKIDPFDNPKKITSKLEIKRNQRLFCGLQSYYQTGDNQTLIAKKDYKNLLHLESSLLTNRLMFGLKENEESQNNISTDKEYTENQKENLKKQYLLNDNYLSRMHLDLYIL